MSNPFRSGFKQAIAVFVSAVMLTACTSTPPKNSPYSTQITLGPEQQLIGLYSWPNKPGGTESLADTIKHYLQQTVTRDGFNDVNIVISAPSGGVYSATLTSANPAINDYATLLPNFLTIGQLGYDGAQALMKTPIWQKDTWRFFLPLGLAMENQASVQLLHFPPDYSLPEQDYLGSKTSQRWESLLEANGVPPANVTFYETIIDIAPVAAPASDGSKLTETYPYFADYAHKMLNNLAGPKAGMVIGRPIVAYGSPVRDWVQQQFGVTLQVNGTDYLKLSDTAKAAALGANHPSYFWYAAEQSCDQGWSVMQQDLISARWQMIMGTYPDKDPNSVLSDATNHWGPSSYPQICQMTRQQASQCTTAPMKNCP